MQASTCIIHLCSAAVKLHSGALQGGQLMTQTFFLGLTLGTDFLRMRVVIQKCLHIDFAVKELLDVSITFAVRIRGGNLQ